MSIDAVRQDIRAGKFRRMYLFFGPEEYLFRRYTTEIEHCILDEMSKIMNKQRLNGPVTADQLKDACDTLPVFASRRLVIVQNSGLFKTGGPKKTSKKKSETLPEDVLEDIPESTVLIFWEESTDKRLKTYTAVQKHGLIVECALQKPADLEKWAARELQSRGCEPTREAVAQLIDYAEPTMTDIEQEIEKLSLYASASRMITGDDVRKVCHRSLKSRIFDLTDALGARSRDEAFRVLQEMLEQKEPGPRIAYMIARHMGQMLRMRPLIAQGAPAPDIATKLGMAPFAVGKMQKQLRNFDEATLVKAVREACKLDWAVKTGQIDDMTALHMLIALL